MVQRYDLLIYHETGGDRVKADDGDYVKYEDYAKLEAELQKYKDQFPDYVECANCGSVTHVEGVEHDGKESAWTVWCGGENPVPGRLVDVKFRDGTIAYKDDSCIYRWRLCNSERDSDIIAYRVVG